MSLTETVEPVPSYWLDDGPPYFKEDPNPKDYGKVERVSPSTVQKQAVAAVGASMAYYTSIKNHTPQVQEQPKGPMIVGECAVELTYQDEFIEVEEDHIPTAVKFDTGKLDWSLMPWDSVEEILKVLEFGRIKYDSWNWAQGDGFKYSRVFNASIRHLFAWFRGEDNDPESGLSHIAHLGCNVLFLLYFIKHKNKYTNNDDRV
jgi:hypothetical protein